MKNLEPHRHTRLQSPRSIRILKLLPSVKQNAPIQCRLAELDIDNYTSNDYKTPGPYEALSYVWGSRYGSIPIECDGKSLLVTENCHNALIRLRRRFRSRALWIDSICIDQEKSKPSEEERISQIQLMGEVYRIAKCVIVWLGQCSVSTKETLRILRVATTLVLIANRTRNYSDNKWLEEMLWILVTHLQENTNCRQSWIELKNNPWFSRCWTIQEVAFSRNCVVKWGSFSIGWQSLFFGVFIIEIREIRMPAACINTGCFPALAIREESRWMVNPQAVRSIRLFRYTSHYPSPESLHVEINLLSSALEHDATIPYDKIFSIYPLLRLMNLELPQITYDKPFDMLCEELTRCWFYSKKNLSIILLAARLPNSDSRLPSWVPDWENRQSALDYRLAIHKREVDKTRGVPDEGGRASNGSLFEDPPEGTTGELHLQGLSLGLILRALACDIPNHLSFKQSVFKALRVFRTWYCAVEASSLYATHQESQSALHFTIHTSVLIDKEELYVLELSQAKKAHELFLEAEGGDELLCQKALSKIVTFLSTPSIDKKLSALDPLSSSNSKPSVALVHEDFYLGVMKLTAILIRIQNHSLLIIDNCCGLSAYTAQEGDEVFLLKGLDVPVVLRPNGENYSFVTPCSYIHGVMEGQKWPEDESELQDLVLV
ncbi:uncharacterized protein EAF02_011082 [Botrytis sinoallii]|uniref:uncharacterized protein n=1 Tax=Botrytis sinoallii TaxID=1463999 RepID=UPI00190243A2|nr:uncharacterized protein EAF02_011082 [Botrytis sinoallii]KAF7858758.1 hypothetical protein EAF02_011082 [Botrytis sinoallii]